MKRSEYSTIVSPMKRWRRNWENFKGQKWKIRFFLLKCYFDQKLTPIFFHKSKVLMFNTYHANFQVYMYTRSVINWAIISGFGRPPLQNSNMAGNNWESWGGREVTSSNQDSKNNLGTLGFCSCFLRIRSRFELNSSVHDNSMPASRCVVQDCDNGSNPREGISFHNSPPSGIVLSSWKRFVSSHHKNFNPTGRFAVCSELFTDDCFARFYHFGGSMKRLAQGAIP